MKGRIHSRESFGTVDGPGIRFVLFLQGCPLRCLFCHNPDSQTGMGQDYVSAEEMVREILRYKSFIQSGGVTFSGGEPLIQAAFVKECADLLHREGLHIAIDTSGSESPNEDDVRAAIDAADMLLLDIKAAQDEVAVRLTGRDLTNAFATLDYCEQTGKPVWVRHVLLTGYTLDETQLQILAQRLSTYSCIERLELLPFHKMGETKWTAMNRSYQLYDTPATTKEQARWAAEFFQGCPFTVSAPK